MVGNYKEQSVGKSTARVKRVAAAYSVESATAVCTAVLGMLPPADQKKVLAALRKKTAPATPGWVSIITKGSR